MPAGKQIFNQLHVLLFYLCFNTNPCIFSSQLVTLGPEELGDWEKPKPEPKNKKTKAKKTAEGEEEEEEEDEHDQDEEEDEDEETEKSKETYNPRPTRLPRGNTSSEPMDPAPAADSRKKRKATVTPHRHDSSAEERRIKRLKGAGKGTQPTLHEMGFVASPTG